MQLKFKFEEEVIVIDTDDIRGFSAIVEKLTKSKAVDTLQVIYRDLMGGTGELQRSEAIALSEVKLALVRLEGPPKVSNNLRLMPKDQWWYCFIDQQYQDPHKSDHENALRFDLDASPGFFNALMTLFEELLAPISYSATTNIVGSFIISLYESFAEKKVTAEMYLSYHQRVTNKALMQMNAKTFMPVDAGWSDNSTSFAMDNLVSAPTMEAISELVKLKILGVDKISLPLFLKKEFPKGTPPEEQEILFTAAQLTEQIGGPDTCLALFGYKYNSEGGKGYYSIHANYSQKQAPQRLQMILDNYYQERDVARKQSEDHKLLVIVKCIRTLHVGHFFPDANGRLNIMLLLNKFLLEEGFLPVILRDPAVFGGALSFNALIVQVKQGMETFLIRAKEETAKRPDMELTYKVV